MEWLLVLIVVLSVGWAMRGRMRRGEREDEDYNGGHAADPALMELGRQKRGGLW